MDKLNRMYPHMRALIESAQGRYCFVEFMKKDGSMRRMIVQPAMLKFKVVGNAASDAAKRRTKAWKENNPNLMPVWDVEAEGIRSINLDTVTQITVDKRNYRYA